MGASANAEFVSSVWFLWETLDAAFSSSCSFHALELSSVLACRGFSPPFLCGECTAVCGCCTSCRGCPVSSHGGSSPQPGGGRGHRGLASCGGRRGQEGQHVRGPGHSPPGEAACPPRAPAPAPAHGPPRFLEERWSGRAAGQGQGQRPLPGGPAEPPWFLSWLLAGSPAPLSVWVPCGLLLV